MSPVPSAGPPAPLRAVPEAPATTVRWLVLGLLLVVGDIHRVELKRSLARTAGA
jgi:hypothetical protein